MKSPVRAERLYLSDARDAIDRIVAYTADGHAHFVADPKTQDAAVRNLAPPRDALTALIDTA